MTVNHKLRLGTALMVSASSVSLAMPALAADVLFSSKGDRALSIGERVHQLDGLRQVRLDSGATVSVLDAADYRINADGSVDLYAGTLTVAGGEDETTVRMPDGVEGRVTGRKSAASFSVAADGTGRGHVMTGRATVGRAGEARRFDAGEMFAFAPGKRPEQTVANGAQPTPGASRGDVAAMAEGGPAAAAANGLPVTLGNALAAAGASSDILGAARRVDAAVANPAIETFPSGDLALLVANAGGVAQAFGGAPFPEAQADIVRTYLAWLAGGGSGAGFLSAYAGFLTDYLDLLRSGAAPSSFGDARLGDIAAFLAYSERTGALARLGTSDRLLADAYLAFLKDGGNPDLFAGRFVDLTRAYFAFVRAGGDPADFTGASADTIGRYVAFLADSGLAQQLGASDRALLDAYLASGGLAFAGQYRAALGDYYAWLASGRLPGDYGALDAATLRSYLETLSRTGLLATVAGDQAAFFTAYLDWLRGGGAPDAFAGLPANVFAGYAGRLDAYFAWLAAGNLPSAYDGADIAQLQGFIAQLQSAGALDRFLGERADFFAAYLAFVQGGGQADAFAGLNANIFAGYAQALSAYYDYLENGGVPSAYGALTQAQVRAYLAALDRAGASASFLADLSDFYAGYFAFVAGGGNPDQYAGLPVPPDYPAFAAALNAYAAFLAGGGLPADYDAQTLATLQAYIDAIAASGQLADLLGDNAGLLDAYFAWIAGGGSPNGFSGLPVYADYVSALNAYYAFLASGGLPADYGALTPAQVRAYLAALNTAGGLSAFADLDGFFAPYYAYLAGGGDPAKYAELPVYDGYVAALNAYYAYLAGGGLPGAYGALTQEQVAAYLAALNAAGGFAAHGDLDAFFGDYYAFLASGGDPADYARLPVYAGWLQAVQAYYAFLLGGGVPSEYGALTPEQVKTYLAALDRTGILDDQLSGATLQFLTDYLAWLETGSDPDQFAGLPGNSGGPDTPDNPAYAGGFPSGVSGARAYAVNAGVSYQASATPQLDANGVLTDAGDLAIGTAQAVDVGGDAAVVVGRYVDGAARFRGGTVNAAPGGGVPWVVTAPVAAPLPTSGTIDYEVLAATRPVFSSGRAAPGSFDANLTIGFGPSSLAYGFDGTIVMPEDGGDVRYDFASEGRDTGALVDTFTVNPVFNMNGKMTGSGDACSSDNCLILFYGGFGGSEERVGMTYQTVDSPNFRTAERIQGTVAFAATGDAGSGNGDGGDPVLAASDGVAPTGAAGNVFAFQGAGGGGQGSATSMTVTDGLLTDATASFAAVAYTPNSASTVEKGGDQGRIGWSRIANVPVGYRGGTGQSFTATAYPGQSWHTFWGAPAVNLPVSGLVTYDLIGATTPTQSNARPGTGSFAGNFAVDFATLEAGLEGRLSFEGETYSFASSGGVADPSMAIRDDGAGGMRFNENLATSTSAGASVARGTYVQGFLAGDGATHAGITYSVRVASSNAIQGAATFRAQPTVNNNPYATAPGALIASSGEGGEWGRWSVPVPGDAPTDGMPMASAPASAVRGGIDRDAQRLKAEALLGGLVTFPQK